MIKRHIMWGIGILSNPEKSFKELEGSSLELAMNYYIVLLVSGGILAGVVNLLFSILKTIYLDIFVNADVVYLSIWNFLLSRSLSFVFLYLVAGTFGLFLVSILFKSIFHIKYVTLLKIMMYSSSPLLLFAWIPYSQFALLIWSLFIFISSKAQMNTKISRNSIRYRY